MTQRKTKSWFLLQLLDLREARFVSVDSGHNPLRLPK
jgi:hypothetical protein